MNTTTIAAQRALAISATVARIRDIERSVGVAPAALERIKSVLLELAQQTELFPIDDFPPAKPGDKRNSCLYRLAEDDDHRFALYINSAALPYESPPHFHTTWAVIVGLYGEEHNRFYRRSADGGVEQTGGAVVTRGTGVAFLPEDLHSIHIKGDAPMLNFHMYGLALEQLHERRYFHLQDGVWRTYPAHVDIREARGR